MRKLTTLSLLLIASLFLALIPQISSAAVTGFQPGRIIDDMVFTNNLSMTPAQIQTFLSSKLPSCDTWGTQMYNSWQTRAQYSASRGYSAPFTCLKDYSENGKSSAQIVYDVAQQYKINPQVLIVLLQKEQALVTDDWPWSIQYRSATGYGCPDTAACDATYYGFTNQVTWAAKMFRRILDNDPNWYTPYVLGSNYILYSPDTSCGGSMVNIQNRSTQALYNYTPYQPNQAALDAGWGTAPCGAYGNRNFYSYFTSWFGPTQRNLVRIQGGGVYQVENGQKRAFPNEITFLSYFYSWSNVLVVSPLELSLMPEGANMIYNPHYREGRLVVAPSTGVYLVDNGKKRALPSIEAFNSYSYKWYDVLTISSNELSIIPDGTALTYNVHFRDGKLVSNAGGVYLIENGTKRPVPSAEAFISYSYKWSDVVPVSSNELSMIPDGTALRYNVHYRDGKVVGGSSMGLFYISNGQRRWFPTLAVFYSNAYKLSDVVVIGDDEINLIPSGPDM